MKNITLRLIVLLTIMLGMQGLVNAAPDPNFHIYICFGQSNMEGAGQVEQSDKVNVNERFKMMATVSCNGSREMGKWYTAVPPLARCNTGLSPADYFGRTLVEKLDENIKVGVIVVAVGGADIQLFEEDGYQSYLNTAADWLKNWAKEYDNNCYKRIIDMAKIAQQDGVIKGILVHQGETNNMQQNWPNRLKAIYENMLSDLNLKGEEVPLLVGETRRDGVCSGHNQVIANVPNVIPNSYVISSEGLEKTNDDYHFSAQGYRDFGKRYAEQMLKLLPASSEPESGSQPEENEPKEDIDDKPITGPKGGADLYVNSRRIYAYAPNSLTSNRPLLISCHGMDQSIEYQRNQAKWEQIADTANFLVVYPGGGTGYSTWDISGDKDVNFILSIIDEMHKQYNIDKSRVYMSGFSMGGMLTYHLMAKIPDRIAAFAPVSGHLMGGGSYSNVRPLPLIHVHGTSDSVVPYDGSTDYVNGWAKQNGCNTTPVVTQHNNGSPSCKKEVWTGGECETEVVRISFNGRDHEHNNSGALHTSQEIWNFVKNYSLECGKVGSSGISFTSPSASGKYSEGDVLPISVKAGKNVDIDKIVISVDGEEMVTLTSEPWSAEWSAVSGDHVIKAVATLADGSKVEATSKIFVNIPQTPYNGTPSAIPGKIEAEEFDFGGEGYAYSDKDAENRNGGDRDEGVDMSNTAIGYTQTGEWLEYTVNVEEAGEYAFEAYVASGADGASFKLYIDNEAITDIISVPNTGDWETFVTVESNIENLPAGKHVLKLEITGDWLDMDYMNFKLVSQNTGMNIPLSDFWVENSECDVFSLLGQKIKTVNNRNELKDLPAGVYLLRNTQTQKVKKVVISE
jgi:poly(3-hydroxybutyrate) depolymerase